MFGAPERLPDHADRAVAAAATSPRQLTSASATRCGFGIGVNSGPVVVGSVGGGGRLEFAVIGDPVNVAARVEHLTRETGDIVLLTEATRCLLPNGSRRLEPRGELCTERRVRACADLRACDHQLDESLRSVFKNPSSSSLTLPK